MMKLFLLTFACMMCTISMAWGCVCNGGPCWEARQAVTPGPGGETRQPGTPGPGGRPGLGFRQETRMVAGIEASLMRPMPVVPLGRPVGPVGTSGGSSLPGIPVEVARYFAGLVSKESAFASIDLDGNGLVSENEWTLGGGAVTEFSNMLIRFDANGDGLISLVELQSFSLPTAPTKRTIKKLGLPHEY